MYWHDFLHEKDINDDLLTIYLSHARYRFNARAGETATKTLNRKYICRLNSSQDMEINSLSPMLYTNDIEESVNFFVQMLGFECKALEPDEGWGSVQLGDIRILFSRPNAHAYFEHPFFTGSFYFRVSDIDSLWNKLRETTSVCYPIEDFDYGMREFAIYDNNGYLLQFGQEVLM